MLNIFCFCKETKYSIFGRDLSPTLWQLWRWWCNITTVMVKVMLHCDRSDVCQVDRCYRSYTGGCYTVLHSATQCYTVLHSSRQCYTVLDGDTQCNTMLYSTTQGWVSEGDWVHTADQPFPSIFTKPTYSHFVFIEILKLMILMILITSWT